jgi:hypothetical protein
MNSITKWIAPIMGTALLCISTTAWAQLRVTLDTTDGSRLVGNALEETLQVTVVTPDRPIVQREVPISNIRTCVIDQQNKASITLQTGENIVGAIQNPQFRLETQLGRLAPEFRNITRIAVGNNITALANVAPATPPPPDAPIPTITFGGVEWTPWKTLFEIQGDKLVSLPKARPGFNYGHSGSGRGPVLITGLGSPDLRDYSAEFEFCVTGVDPAFNPYGLGQDYHDGAIMFHIANGSESWNDPKGGSSYSLGVQGNGKWELVCSYNDYCPAPLGYTQPINDGHRELAKGEGLKIDRQNGNKFRIDIAGQHIQIWVDSQKIVDLVDESMNENHKGTTIDHGGIGFHCGFDAMGWIRNFSLRKI